MRSGYILYRQIEKQSGLLIDTKDRKQGTSFALHNFQNLIFPKRLTTLIFPEFPESRHLLTSMGGNVMGHFSPDIQGFFCCLWKVLFCLQKVREALRRYGRVFNKDKGCAVHHLCLSSAVRSTVSARSVGECVTRPSKNKKNKKC